MIRVLLKLDIKHRMNSPPPSQLIHILNININLHKQETGQHSQNSKMINLLIPLALLPIYIILRRIYYTILYPSISNNGPIPRPPLVGDWIPFVGNALNMTTGDKFWKKIVKGHGPAFRLRAMGEVRTFVTTPGVSRDFQSPISTEST